jgi:hypothetical protein
VPFLVLRAMTIYQLGLGTVAETMVTRTDFFGFVEGGVNPLSWLLNSLFSVTVVSLLCLAVRYAFPVPARAGAFAYAAVLMLCIAGTSPSGGRNELAFVSLTVLFFMYLQGYRSARAFVPLVVPALAAATVLVMVAQARNGADNALAQAAGNPYVGESYSTGELTQVLGLGRFDTVLMIVDRHDTSDNLGVGNYVESLKGGLDASFLPRVVLGHELGSVHVSGEVIGPWVFGEAKAKASALPSAPGELYVSFGYPGVVVGAILAGLLGRGLLRVAAAVPGPAEFAWVLAVWTLARAMSDESHLVTVFAVRTWWLVAVVALLLALRRGGVGQPGGTGLRGLGGTT